MLGDIERQLKYEEESDSNAVAAKLQKVLTEAAEGSADTTKAKALMSRIFGEVRDNIEATKAVPTRGPGGKYKNWLRAIPSDVAAVIAIRDCINWCANSKSDHPVRVQDLTRSIGSLYDLEARILAAEKVNPMYMQRIHDQVKENCTTSRGHLRRLYNVAVDRVMKGEVDFKLTATELVQLGKHGVDACVKAGLIYSVRGTCKTGVSVIFHLNEEVHKFLMLYSREDLWDVVSKEESRMYCPPDEWTNLFDGGYLTPRRKAVAPLLKLRNIRKSERERVTEEFTAERMPMVFEAGNYMQSMAFSLHEPTRKAIQRVWDSGGGILGVPRKNPPNRPEMPLPEYWDKAEATPEELDQFYNWKRDVGEFYRELRTWRGKVREIGAFMRVSKEYNVPIWFPMYFDNRGRWYYRGVPNPQGSDLSKATLHFHEKKPLGKDGLFWLKVHIANSAGFDKERFVDRARWTEKNWEAIARALDAPEDYPDVWGTDAPWCMYSAAWELRAAYQTGHPEKYCTGIVCHMDATCSGLQHFSALLRDPVGAAYVNLEDQAGCGPKQDIYSKVATNALSSIKRDLEGSDEEVRSIAKWWLEVGFPRSLAKKPVMTYVYGATLLGTSDHIEHYVKYEMSLEFPGGASNRVQYCQYAAKKLFYGIAATVPAAANAMQWLKEVTRQMPKGKRMEWKTPTGFLVQHDYRDTKSVIVYIHSCGLKETLVRDFTDDTKVVEMTNAISPNFVHALDASHLTMTAVRMKKAGLSMVGIHDSFGTHMCDAAEMHKHIREAFVELYAGKNLLAEFLWDVGGTGETPLRGDFDLSKVLDSEFFFC